MKISCVGITVAALLVSSVSAKAAVIINVAEVGGDVVFSTSGSLDLTGTTALVGFPGYFVGFIPGGSSWYIAPGTGGAVDRYALTAFDGPFGTSTTLFDSPTSVSGDDFFIWGQPAPVAHVGVPVGYLSGSPIAAGMVFANATIAGFTMIPGTYTYTLPNDTITLNVGQVVPEPMTLTMLGIGAAAFAVSRRRRKA